MATSKRTMTSRDIKTHPSSKGESGSEEIHTAPLSTEEVKITRKHRTRHGGTGDYIHEDVNEESTAVRAIMTKNKVPTERNQECNSPSANNQEQTMGDHYHHLNIKQHKSRNRTPGRYHQELDENNLHRWRLFIYILTIGILAFVIYRFLLTMWPKQKRTLIEQFVDDLFSFFTP